VSEVSLVWLLVGLAVAGATFFAGSIVFMQGPPSEQVRLYIKFLLHVMGVSALVAASNDWLLGALLASLAVAWLVVGPIVQSVTMLGAWVVAQVPSPLRGLAGWLVWLLGWAMHLVWTCCGLRRVREPDLPPAFLVGGFRSEAESRRLVDAKTRIEEAQLRQEASSILRREREGGVVLSPAARGTLARLATARSPRDVRELLRPTEALDEARRGSDLIDADTGTFRHPSRFDGMDDDAFEAAVRSLELQAAEDLAQDEHMRMWQRNEAVRKRSKTPVRSAQD
jgi:hypothetical protein